MAISLRKRPVCHYCGKRNNPINARKFKCNHCLADNFLDENGEIQDVPADVAQVNKQYAIPVEPLDPSQSIFCSTCLKNQHMYTDAMSHFLPDDDHPEYTKFEDALPAFKKRMEQQYPQCCVDCEPKVQAQLQQATYNARSDHLRRVLDRSRVSIGSTLGWRSLVVNGAGLGYLLSLVIQLLWHAMGSQSSTRMVPNLRPTNCFMSRPAAQCPDMVEQFMGVSMLLGVFFGWWNPKWHHKLKGRKGRLTGLAGYYRAQVAVLMVRFAAWVALRDVPALEQHRPMLHSVSLVLIILIAGYTNLNIIKVDTTPLVNWQQKQEPLVTNRQRELNAPPVQQPSDRLGLLQNLQTTQPQLGAWRPPTPPNDDAMDWMPSPAVFVPEPKKIVYKSTQPSPFVGALPELPRQGIFASRIKNQPEPAKAIGIPQGFFDKRDTLKQAKDHDQVFAQPKFFAQNADTGLENIFGKVFSLDEDAMEVRNQSKPAESLGKSNPPEHDMRRIWMRAVTVAVLGMMTVYASTNSYLGLEIDRRVIVWALVVPVLNISLGLARMGDTSLIVSNLFGGLVLIALLLLLPREQSLLLPMWNKLVNGTTGLLLLREVYHLCTVSTVQPGPNSAPPTTDTQQMPLQPVAAPQIIDRAEEVLHKQQSHMAVLEPTTPRAVRSRRDSNESMSSEISSTSTSTSSGWKTPKVDSRMTRNVADLGFGRTHNTRNSGFGMGGLGLEDFTSGSTVAGPRTRSKRGQAW